MLDPNVILDALAAHARGIPELLAEVRQDPQRIFAWKDKYPGDAVPPGGIRTNGSSLVDAIANQPTDSVMFALEGPLRRGPGSGVWWEHRMIVTFFPGLEPAGQAGQVYRMMRALANGVTPGVGRWLHVQHVAGVEPIAAIDFARAPVQRANDGIQVWAGRFSVMDEDAGPLE